MAIQWGGWSGNLRVGIEVATTGYDTWTPAIDVHVRTFVQCSPSFDFADNQLVTLRGTVSADYRFFNNLQANQVIQVGTYVITGQGQSYGGGPDYYFEARLSEAFNGAAPAVGVNYRLPPRPARVPAPPSHGPHWSRVTATSGFAQWGITPDAGGSGLIEDDMQVSRHPDFAPHNWAHAAIAPGSSRQVDGLAPGTRYYSRARVRNGVGWSGWSEITQFQTDIFVTSAPGVIDIGPDTATVVWRPPNGGTPTGYEVQWARNPELTNELRTITSATWADRRRLEGLNPGTRYWARVRSATSYGYGEWSSLTEFETLSGVKIRRNGVWVDAPVYVRVNGQWKIAKVHKRIGGRWVL